MPVVKFFLLCWGKYGNISLSLWKEGNFMDYREKLQRNLTTGRSSLLMVLVLTVVNIGLVLAEGGRYFVCSVAVPYMLCYMGYNELSVWDIEISFPGAMAVSIVILGVLFAIWAMSKKRPGLLYIALILFIADTLVLLKLAVDADTLAESVVDLLFHGWVIWELFQGARCGNKLVDVPGDAPITGADLVRGPTTGADFLKGNAAEESTTHNF
jgi:hypothetical protein